MIYYVHKYPSLRETRIMRKSSQKNEVQIGVRWAASDGFEPCQQKPRGSKLNTLVDR